MIGKIIVLSLGLTSSAWALPWLSLVNEAKAALAMNKSAVNPVNFSGVWVGSCDFKPAVDLTIKHEGELLSISYGFMEDKYRLGELKSTTSSQGLGSEHETAFAQINHERQAIIFINSTLFRTSEHHGNAFFSKVIMALNGGVLTVKGQYFQADEDVGDIVEDVISCVYRLKREK